MEISPDSLLEQFSSKKDHGLKDLEVESLDITTSQLSDALKNLTGEYGIVPGIKPIKKNLKIKGRIVTVKTSQNDWGTSLKSIETANKGEIIFIACDGDEVAVWGELSSKNSQIRGLGGTVIYGATRDVEAVCNLNYPVFSRAVVPNAGQPLANGEDNITLNCGGVEVKPGDWVFGDDCGVVIIDKEIVMDVVKEALRIKKDEDKILRHLEEGLSLSEILGI